MTKPKGDPAQYRPAAGIAIFNHKGQVWLGHRVGKQTDYVWQMPQGGMDPGESPEFAAMREMEEETGITLPYVKPLGRIKKELFYDFPANYRHRPRAKKWLGQRQTWFAVRFIGKPRHVNINAHKPAEFTKWKWGALEKTPDLIVPFKRKVYEQVAKEFADFAKPVK